MARCCAVRVRRTQGGVGFASRGWFVPSRICGTGPPPQQRGDPTHRIPPTLDHTRGDTTRRRPSIQKHQPGNEACLTSDFEFRISDLKSELRYPGCRGRVNT